MLCARQCSYATVAHLILTTLTLGTTVLILEIRSLSPREVIKFIKVTKLIAESGSNPSQAGSKFRSLKITLYYLNFIFGSHMYSCVHRNKINTILHILLLDTAGKFGNSHYIFTYHHFSF